ncbi:hypothetical protein PHISP_06039 [Aspergillus sp. HF37]|nr:hypothetical protein PHISP_06039 [Aspergillus sp. HF37]
MELVILVAAFIGSNLWSMFGPVPFIRIDPTTPVMERLVGSFQLTSVIYALQEIHPLVFPEATLDPPPPRFTRDPFPLPPKTQDVFRTVTKYVDNAATSFSAATRGRSMDARETSLQPVGSDPTYPPLREWNVMAYVVLPLIAVVVFAAYFVWKSPRRAPATENQPKANQPGDNQSQQPPSDGVVVDRVLFERLIEPLAHEFQNRPSGHDQSGEDRASRVVGILDLLRAKFPPGAGHDNDPRIYNTLLRLSERVTKVEKAIDLMFSPVELPDASGPDDNPDATSQGSSQTGFTQYKEAFDRNMKAVDPTISNTVSSIQQEMAKLKKMQSTLDRNAGRNITNLKQKVDGMARTLGNHPTGLQPLMAMGREFRTEDPFLQRLVNKLDADGKWIRHLGQVQRSDEDAIEQHGKKIRDLQKQLKHIHRSTVLLVAENQGLWSALKTVGKSPSEVTGSNDGGGSFKDSQTGHQSYGSGSQSGEQDQKSVAALETLRLSDPSMSAVRPNVDSENVEASDTRAREVNLYDADTDPGSEEPDAACEAAHPSAANKLPSQPLSQSPMAPEEMAGDHSMLTTLEMEQQTDSEISAALEREFIEHFKARGSVDDIETESQEVGEAPETSHPPSASVPEQSEALGPVQRAKDTAPNQKPQEEPQDQHPPAPEKPAANWGTSPAISHGDEPQGNQLLSEQEKQRKQNQAGSAPNIGPMKLEGSKAGEPEQQSQSSTVSLQKTKPPVMIIAFDPNAYGARNEKSGPSFPPASTKSDYQPLTPKKPGQFGRYQKGAPSKGKEAARKPVGQAPPARESATGEERQKLQGWGTFSDTAFAREMEESQKVREEARKNPGPASASWQESVTWKQNTGSEESDSAPERSGRRRSEPPGGAMFASTTQRRSVGNLSHQSQSTQQPSAAGTAELSPQTPGAGNQDGRGRGGGRGNRGRGQSGNRGGNQGGRGSGPTDARGGGQGRGRGGQR